MTPSFQGEVQFRRYSDTSTQGQQVVFAVQDRDALESFIGKEGKRFMAVLVEIGDDEQPVESKGRGKLGDLCYRAVMWCRDETFCRWLAEEFGYPEEVAPEDIIKEVCSVNSRKELDAEPARGRFISQVVGPWQRYCIARGLA